MKQKIIIPIESIPSIIESYRNGENCRIIANKFGCHKSKIANILKHNGVTLRSNVEAKKLIVIQSKYPLLNDKDWLYKKYVVEKLGINKIISLCGCKTSNSVRQALIKYNIPLRSIGEGLTCNRESDGLIFNDYTRQIIEGCLLGDGFMRKWKKDSVNGNALFAKRNKFFDHILFVANEIFNKNKVKERIGESIEKCSWDKTKPYTVFTLRTFNNKELKPIYESWYPKSNNYVKKVPLGFKLTKISLLHWFMDDGCSYRRKRENIYKNTNRKGCIAKRNTNQVIVSFCSESFSKEDNIRLIKQMKSIFGINSRLKKYKGHGTGWRIELLQSQAKKFFEIIGPCPVPSLAYKWKD